ncbi:dipeptide ABC transporter ATP-binding protein [Sodalis sp. dw_96]|uniref:ABC transporter ATP-binding protein n=1 Tax=Sodalis sp. dw_96 TaxID=2719794 RepID=UPI001BD40C6E|nr:dipeptide ABC transporter ATP-binding protein [Sodalis sp. dw_96]
MSRAILQVNDLKKHFTLAKGRFGKEDTVVKAVDGVSFDMAYGETLALVGESGCGKSTTARLVMKLLDPSAGSIRLADTDLNQLRGGALRDFRKQFQIIFQDPFASLNPSMRVHDILEEPLIINRINVAERQRRVADVLKQVGLSPDHARRYPHEFSGGQRQRVGIARALMLKPSLIVCDEPVSALDVSIQAQIINLLSDLQRDLNLSYLFISHDLSVVKHISDRVAVMYLGKIVEIAPKDAFFNAPAHPYSRALISAIPRPNPGDRARRQTLPGDVATTVNVPGGCRFHPRCPFAVDKCCHDEPLLKPVGDGTSVACHRRLELPLWQEAFQDPNKLSPVAEARLRLYAARRRERLNAVNL